MTPETLLSEASLVGVFITLEKDRLKVTGPADERERLRPALQEHKTAILAHLQGQQAPPAFCSGQACHRYEEIDLPRRGLTPGCIFQGKTVETWRPLHKMAACPAPDRRNK
jgi:hypothetical protein